VVMEKLLPLTLEKGKRRGNVCVRKNKFWMQQSEYVGVILRKILMFSDLTLVLYDKCPTATYVKFYSLSNGQMSNMFSKLGNFFTSLQLNLRTIFHSNALLLAACISVQPVSITQISRKL
jgi:hypothetical protein